MRGLWEKQVNHSLPALFSSNFLSGDQLARTNSTLLGQGSAHGGSSSCSDCGCAFRDELHASPFPWVHSVHVLLVNHLYVLPDHITFIFIIIYPLTARVAGAPQMISQTVSSIFLCSPLPSGSWQTPGLSTPWCCLPTSSSVCLVFVPLSVCLARWFCPDLRNGRHDHTTAVCVSLRWSGGIRVVRLPARSWHGLPRW